jgi:hypothetical protein
MNLRSCYGTLFTVKYVYLFSKQIGLNTFQASLVARIEPTIFTELGEFEFQVISITSQSENLRQKRHRGQVG